LCRHPGTPVGLDATDGGVSYQLYNSGSPVGAAIIGSGVGTLNFGTFLAGTYTVIGTGSGCSTTMTGSATIIIEALPALFNLTGGGTVCSNSAGADIMLSNSTIGTNYQLFNGGSPIGIASGGTGAPIDFGLQTGSGGYSVVATNGAGCSANMTGTPAIIVLSSPPVHNITGGGDYCPGGVGKAVGLDSSNAGIRYQLMYGGSPVGSVLTGSGAPLNFGLYTVTGVLMMLPPPTLLMAAAR